MGAVPEQSRLRKEPAVDVFPGQRTERLARASKVLLRFTGATEMADALNDVSGTGSVSLSQAVRRAERSFDERAEHEFRDLGTEDREAAKDLVVRAYEWIVSDPRQVMVVESVVGTEAIEAHVDTHLAAHHDAELRRESEDFRACVAAFSRAVAAQIRSLCETVPGANRVAMTRAMGEQLQLTRDIAAKLDGVHDLLSTTASASSAPGERAEERRERIEFTIGLKDDWYALADDPASFRATVERAVTAVMMHHEIDIVVSAPDWTAGLMEVDDTLGRPRALRQVRSICERIEFGLKVLFSAQVESAWGHCLRTLDDWVTVARSSFDQPPSAGTLLKIWRTSPPRITAAAYLSPEETSAMLAHLGFDSTDQLSLGAFWRAADELPSRLIVERALPAVLRALSLQLDSVTEDLPEGALSLPSWHIGVD